MTKEKNRDIHGNIKTYFKDKRIQRIIIAVLTVVLAYTIVLNGAMPKKYKLVLNETSPYDITAPRDIINTIKTQENASEAAKAVTPDMTEIRNASIDVVNNTGDLITLIEKARRNVVRRIEETTKRTDRDYDDKVKKIREEETAALNKSIEELDIILSYEQVLYLITKASDDDIQNFDTVLGDLVSDIMTQDVTDDNLPAKIIQLQNSIQYTDLNQEMKNIGLIVAKYILKPNRTINLEATEARKKIAYEIALNDPDNIEKIQKGHRILSVGDIVTPDKFKILEELNLLETRGSYDYVFATGILIILLMLSLLLILYMNNFCKKVFYNRNDLILLSLVILMTLVIARLVYEISTLAIPIFIATILIAILLDLRLAFIVNFILTLAISLMTYGEIKFIFLGTISGAFATFIVSKANQRNKLSIAAVIIGIINVFTIVALDIINKYDINSIFTDAAIVFANGLVSMVITIGLLPFLETTFNIITPLRLLELATPNQPLLKRLLIEAPGTYHHSLMVGNLAEVGTEAVGGNALLARVGAYFHDIGKLRRPSFFIENQMSDNPHDKMTANLSTLVITSHIHDGVEIAKKYRIPLAIRDIILQHHGTTLVAYFYHKARKVEKDEMVDESNFRYDGEKPSSKEAAVVMLADSVEAAVRSMTDKTEGKIEGLVRKIIKDKLDDGQLDQCNLTLKDLDNIAKAFMKVFGGFFHAREEYPDIKNTSKKLSKENTVNDNKNSSNDNAREKTALDAVRETSEQIAADSYLKTEKEKSK